ncbi:Cu-Zn family superoxide dismutase [Luteimonas cucumeris]|uniref:Cu-Zn family superoxide dismutase n=1 Tax=Luteimonas cucumeris TaxID=985012 RepID=A0A562LDP2_9GAMM|nr:superoxide dismutase family protein [Luteimonas cucumeris]TWI05763.1 Cu-Zn family superoxide dismutase [Luteimonas cucumeris]
MRFVLSVIVLSTGLVACSSAPPTREAAPSPSLATRGTAKQAVANLASASASLVSGRMMLASTGNGVRITGEVGGLNPYGAHALQLHERGDCSAVDASSAGVYFDPVRGSGAAAGNNRDRIVADGEGVAHVDQLVPGAVLGGGARNDIAGRALVVLGATRGASSARVACGVITVKP